MSFKVLNDRESDHDVFFQLRQVAGEIHLKACNALGQVLPSGNIMTIKRDGTLYLNTGVSVPGIKTEHLGRIKVIS